MTPPPGTSTIDALVQTVQRLWPDAEQVDLLRRGEHRPVASSGEVQELAAVPDARSARLLVPVGRRSTAAALARYSSALSIREVAQRMAVGAVTTCVGPVMLGDRVRIVEPGPDNIASVVAGIVGQPVTLSLGIGTARANRKPVLGAFDLHGHPVAFVKIGDTPASVAHVAREADSLVEVGRHRWSTIEPPSLLDRVHWRGLDVLVMTALRPRPWQGRDGRWPIPDAAMDELCDVFDGGVTAVASTPLWSRTVDAASRLRDGARSSRLLEALDRVAASAGAVEVALGAWHGDFAPWNMARHGDRLQLWDWERFEVGVPRGMDRYHYAVNTLAREHGFDAPTVTEGLRLGAPGASSTDSAVAAAYLAALAVRYLAGVEEDGGEIVTRRADVTLAVLSELSGHLDLDRTERTSP